ncbi:hypothetical protein LTR84_011220 [Exophiala bonariae]|uniref:Ubiquinol-cytochrome c chaperone domain-containing protein n=1 Tax=Exophiala bonariae TaxID=1690606 RepID=A0AAV9NIX4_9EURO|nr:hypothetical protein LTR84_011220 [Exophiala bonariae]
MNSSTLCTRCLRTFRHSVGTGSRANSYRSFSSAVQRYEQAADLPGQRATTGRPLKRTNATSSIPSRAAATATTHGITTKPEPSATEPITQSSSPYASSQNNVGDMPSAEEVSQMQKQIQRGMQPDSIVTRLAKGLRKTAKSTTDTYVIYGETERIFKVCAKQADYTIPEDQRTSILTGKGPPKAADGADLGQPVGPSWWYDTLGLEPTFATWSQVTYLHMYIITLRFRDLETPAASRDYQRYLNEHFSHAAEDKMVLLHNMSARSIRNKYLKDLFLQWRGCLTAYDEGLVKGDAVLAGAIWRNVFRGDENVDWEKVAQVVSFLRNATRTFGNQDLYDIVHQADGPKGLWAQTHAS